MVQKGLAPIAIILIVAALIGGHFLYQNKAAIKSATQQTSSTTNETVNWKTYTNTKYGYSIKYPSEWEYKFGKGENSSTFRTNPSRNRNRTTGHIG